MPDNRDARMNGVSPSSNTAAMNKLEDSLGRMKIQVDKQDNVEDNLGHYPDRPAEPDCVYYLRTGSCGYGSSCRFNHPAKTGQIKITQSRGELPERGGQPDCQHFLRTGMCRFGATCKYHHPRDIHDADKVPLNILGLPMRQEEKPCSYYMRTMSCKYGIACKFHHPQPAAVGAVLPVAPSTHCYTGPSTRTPSGVSYVGDLPLWSLSTSPYTCGASVQSLPSYVPVVYDPSQGMIPVQQCWTTYISALSQSSSSDSTATNLLPNSQPSSDPDSSGLLLTSVHHFPERSDQPECRYYMKTGSCKYGSTCKYHHPKERNVPLATGTLGPLGLPFRPGQAICTSYSTNGICKYGSSCKYDHPLAGYYCNYSLPALSIPDPSLNSYQINSQISLSSSGASPSKALKSDGVTESGTVGSKLHSLDKEAPDVLSTQTVSPSQTSISSDSPHDHLD